MSGGGYATRITRRHPTYRDQVSHPNLTVALAPVLDPRSCKKVCAQQKPPRIRIGLRLSDRRVEVGRRIERHVVVLGNRAGHQPRPGLIAVTAVPFSDWAIAYAICSTLDRFRFIIGFPNRGRNHPRKLSLSLDHVSGSRPPNRYTDELCQFCASSGPNSPLMPLRSQSEVSA